MKPHPMKVSSKTRYALGVLILLSNRKQTLALNDMAQQLGVSKLYLEQVMAALKSHQLVQSTKGPSGGYTLHQADLSVWDVFVAMEVDQANPLSEQAFDDAQLNQLLTQAVYTPLHQTLKQTLSQVRIQDLALAYLDEPMFFI
jgi:Rrf2 family protein